jgi:hypothetical protein
MGRKTKAPRPTRADRAAEQADFKTWLADSVAALQRDHNINPGMIPIRIWRRLYIQGRSPQKATDEAADRLKRRCPTISRSRSCAATAPTRCSPAPSNYSPSSFLMVERGIICFESTLGPKERRDQVQEEEYQRDHRQRLVWMP